MDEDKVVQEQVAAIDAITEKMEALDPAELAPAEVAELKAIGMRGLELLREIGGLTPTWQERLLALQDEALKTAGAALQQAKVAEGRAATAALVRAEAALGRASRYGDAAHHTPAPAPLEAVKSFLGFFREAEDDEQTVALYGARDGLRLLDWADDDDDPEAA